jgi:hypothetical protein
LASFNEPKGYTMQAKYYALTAMVSGVVAMSAQAQTSPYTQPNTIIVVPATQPSTIVLEKRAPGVGAPATSEDVRAETRAEMKAGLPRGEQSTPTQGSKPEFIGSEMMWKRDQISVR